jgi:hypothetical protein
LAFALKPLGTLAFIEMPFKFYGPISPPGLINFSKKPLQKPSLKFSAPKAEILKFILDKNSLV